jgi:tetratricopeptide (TPR) repeat protein
MARCAGVLFSALLLVTVAAPLLRAESGILVVHIEDVKGHPIGGLQIGVRGDGGTATTADDGKARVRLAPSTKDKSWVSLQIVRCPPHKDFVMVSPWDYRTLVPSFQNESDNFVEVVVVLRGDRSALENGIFLRAATAKINQADSTSGPNAAMWGAQTHLDNVAKEYGVSPKDLDQHIRQWGDSTKDPFESGLVALYARSYEKASAELANSLEEREKKLAADRKDVADAAFFLGVSKHEEGKYLESVAAYERCLQLRPDDPTVLNNLAQSVADSGDLPRAQQQFERALTLRKATLGLKNADTAQSMDSLALLLQNRAKYHEAEALYRQAKQIREEILGPEARETITTINSLAGLFYSEGRLSEAEKLFRQALHVREQREPNGLDTAQTLDSLALCLQVENKLEEAESDYRRAMAIRQAALPGDHPAIAQTLNSLAWLLYNRGEFDESKELYKKALDIRMRVLGPEHPLTATTLDGVGLVTAKSNAFEGEKLIRRALEIRVEKLGLEHPDTATSFDHLGLVLEWEGNWIEAEKSFQQALEILEKVLGQEHPATKISRDHIQELRQKVGVKGAIK